MIRVLSLFLISISAQAEHLVLNFSEMHFYDSYEHQTYIKSDKYIHIDDHYKFDDTGMNVLPRIPEIYSLSLSFTQQKELINKLIKLGVNDWDKYYPKEEEEGLGCHGLSFSLYIKSKELNVYSMGACYFPKNYKEVTEVFTSLHKTPNK